MYTTEAEQSHTLSHAVDWENIDSVFLDMDGTLLDKYFDDYFWEHFVPETYAGKKDVAPAAARQLLLETYRSVENTLQWTDLDYWSERLGLDIPALKYEIRHLIKILPHVIEFLDHLQENGKSTYLITNAHPKTLDVKMSQVGLTDRFRRIICSQEVGVAKEQPEFWGRLQQLLPYDRNRTFFADDTERVLDSAEKYGIRYLVHIAKPSSRLPVRTSHHYRSIADFTELISC